MSRIKEFTQKLADKLGKDFFEVTNKDIKKEINKSKSKKTKNDNSN
jgi:ribosomal protein S17E